MANDEFDIARFYDAQSRDYKKALAEVRAGAKTSHWMWYIFPQLADLGYSPLAKHYGITCIEEAREYMRDETLSARLREISGAFLELKTNDAAAVLGEVDALKLRSCMTLFAEASPEDEVFQQVLDKFFVGEKDARTLEILAKAEN